MLRVGKEIRGRGTVVTLNRVVGWRMGSWQVGRAGMPAKRAAGATMSGTHTQQQVRTAACGTFRGPPGLGGGRLSGGSRGNGCCRGRGRGAAAGRRLLLRLREGLELVESALDLVGGGEGDEVAPLPLHLVRRLRRVLERGQCVQGKVSIVPRVSRAATNQT